MDIKGQITGISSESLVCERNGFLLKNSFSQEQIWFVENLMEEAVENDFIVKISNSK